jgi:gamma-glutamyltranspeptidase/glutathione hydrolase
MMVNSFVDPATGQPLQFQEARVSGISVGVPGAPQTWQTALRKWGTISLHDALHPAIKVADRGFVVDQTFASMINENLAAFSQFSSSSALYLPGGAPPAVGSTFSNPDLARTYRLLSRQGMGAFYRTGVEFLPDGQVVAAAEPVRRGGGSAAVVRPSE